MAPGALHAGPGRGRSRSACPAARPTRGAGGPDRRARCWTCTRTAPATGSKFTSGVVVIAGGGEGLTGAPTMAALAAQRAGAGYVQVAVPEAGPDDAGAAPAGGHDPRAARPRRRPHGGGGGGPGRDGRAGRARWCWARAWAAPTARWRSPAGSAQARGGAAADRRRRPERPRRRAGGPGRAQRPHRADARTRPSWAACWSASPSDIAADRLAAVREAAATSGAVVLLKGDDTIVARPDGLVAVSRGGTPGAGHGGHRRRALGPDRRAAGQGRGAVRRRGAGHAGPRARRPRRPPNATAPTTWWRAT